MRTGVFVQVRLGSTRLPSKALLPLAGMPTIRHVMRALSLVPAEVRALVTDQASAQGLGPAAAAEGFEVFIGHPDDVLGRYCAACRFFGVDTVVRATGDNPFTSAALAMSIMALHHAWGADLSHYLGNPLGTGVEIIEAAALSMAADNARQALEREHITTWLYRHRDRCVILEPDAPREASLPGVEVSIDTDDDYRKMSAVFEHLYRGRPVEAEELVRCLKERVHA